MTLSNSFDFSLTRGDIIKKSLQIIGALPEGQVPSLAQINDASLMVNLLVKSYLAEGLLSWKNETFVLFTEKGKARYDLNSDYGVEWTTEESLIRGALSEDKGLASKTIKLYTQPDSAFVSGDPPAIDTTYNVGLESGITYLWTQVSSVTSQTEFVLADSFSALIPKDAKVYFHNQVANVPHNIQNIYRRNSSDVDVQLTHTSVKDFQWLTSKTQEGTPNTYTIQGDSSVTELYLWPIPDKSERLYILANRGFDDMDDSSSTLSMSNEVYLAFVWEVASNLSFEYGVSVPMISMINRKANTYKDRALSYAMENAYIKFEPDTRYGGN